MGRYFEAADGGAAASFDEFEAELLRAYAEHMIEFIDAREGTGGTAEDLIASAFSEGPTELPGDPALARLFPDAYTDLGPDSVVDGIDAAAASAEFRRYTEHDLRARKRDDAQAVIRSLEALAPEGEERATLHLKPEECRQWLGALNDLRLVLASRLEIVEDEDFEELLELPDDDPRSPLVLTYGWLTALQDTLVEALMQSL
ncbi:MULTISPECIES: DUF2017 domain-containing protein [Glycomyces]|uniref:DUF2017 domain-containing protein n=2 Tax=Glycomyces TaxID=58113 RepID=A0A9X3STD4_9ACTN|nr:DUF2017 domain-containing protein [Glycomyces lechevalierae]MDA1383849.1 DUF2017 domain-containing protein [Glycomyces lechevalierae]MDR7341160.1 hypothetical protein [Glycomyces lechevalierae]